jgi:hypothetical protein
VGGERPVCVLAAQRECGQGPSTALIDWPLSEMRPGDRGRMKGKSTTVRCLEWSTRGALEFVRSVDGAAAKANI